MKLDEALTRVAASTAGHPDAIDLAMLVCRLAPDSDEAKQAMHWLTETQPHINRTKAMGETFLKYYCNNPQQDGTVGDCIRNKCQYASYNGCTHPLRPRYY